MWIAHDLSFYDAYLEWSEISGFQGHAAARGGATARIPLLLEVKQPSDIGDFVRDKLVEIPGIYQSGGSGFCTGWAHRNRLESLQKQVLRLEFALPADSGAVHTDPPTKRSRRDHPVIGVVDRGCAFLNSCFRRRDKPDATRIVALWDQGRAASGDNWQPPDGFGYGRDLGQAEINTLIARLDRESEEQIYRSCGYLIDSNGRLPDFAHGTHVLDVAGGLVSARPVASSAKPTKVDAADDADLIFVDLPLPDPRDTTGAAAGAFLLDAVRYIVHRAGEGSKIVINLSVGALAGPHDGSSLFERALDDLIERNHPNLTVTVAAGNAALEKWHACGTLAPANGQDSASKATLDWRLLPDDGTDSFLEMWFKDGNGGGTEDLRFNVIPPGGEPSGEVRLGEARLLSPNGQAQAMLVSYRQRKKPPESDAMALLAVGPVSGSAKRATAGIWRVEITNPRHKESVLFDAWIQRDEPRSDVGPQLQSFFEDVGGAARIDGNGALSSIATGKRTFVVGASRLDTGEASAYSPSGSPSQSGRWRRPVDALASVDESASAYGLYATGVLSDTLIRMSGTSVSAPVAARYWINRIAAMAATSQLASGTQVVRALAAPFSVAGPIPEEFKSGGWSSDDSIAHSAFGSKSATALWSAARLIALSTKAVHGSVNLMLHQVLRDPDTRRFRVEISPLVADPVGYWLELNDGPSRHGAVLPSDWPGPFRYLVEFDLEYRDPDTHTRRISRFEAGLAPGPLDVACSAARLWETYNTSDAGSAAKWIEDQRLAEQLLAQKIESPLAAAVATLVLLRAGRLELLHDWVRNLANWFPQLPDGATLWAEQVLRASRQPEAIREAAQYTTMLGERGLPVLAETMAYAARHLELLRAREDVLDAATLQRLGELRERIAQVLVYFRGDGLFPVFSGYDDSAQVLGPLGLGAFAIQLVPENSPTFL